MVEKIDADVQDAELNVQAAHNEIIRYFQNISSNRWLIIKIYSVLILFFPLFVSGSGNSVGITTDYGLDGPGIESRWGEIFRTRPDRPCGPPSLLYNGYRVFRGSKAAGVGCGADHPPLLAPRLRMSRAIPLLPSRLFVACYRVTFTFTFSLFYLCHFAISG
jgi:hypothetical protein